MSALTNFADHCDLLNLRSATGGKGPYALRQTGSPPGSTSFQQDPYLLRKDGTWVINLNVFSQSEKDIRENFLYRDIPELFAVIESLGGNPVQVDDKLPAGKSREQILTALRSSASTLISHIREAQGSKFQG